MTDKKTDTKKEDERERNHEIGQKDLEIERNRVRKRERYKKIKSGRERQKDTQ